MGFGARWYALPFGSPAAAEQPAPRPRAPVSQPPAQPPVARPQPPAPSSLNATPDPNAGQGQANNLPPSYGVPYAGPSLPEAGMPNIPYPPYGGFQGPPPFGGQIYGPGFAPGPGNY